MAQEGKITQILAPYGAFITYVPLRGEVPFRDYLDIPSEATVFEIAPRATVDPAAEAKKVMETVGDVPAAILVPGCKFDATGTRHGRGGGWYDRFLAEVPSTWFRIGFCYEEQFSITPLLRQSWDQAMDAVCVIENGIVRIYEAKRV